MARTKNIIYRKPAPPSFKRAWMLIFGALLLVATIISSYFILHGSLKSKVGSIFPASRLAKPMSHQTFLEQSSPYAPLEITGMTRLARLRALITSTPFKIVAAVSVTCVLALLCILIWYLVPSPSTSDLNVLEKQIEEVSGETTQGGSDTLTQNFKDGKTRDDDDDDDQTTNIIIGTCVSFVAICLLTAGVRYALIKHRSSKMKNPAPLESSDGTHKPRNDQTATPGNRPNLSAKKSESENVSDADLSDDPPPVEDEYDGVAIKYKESIKRKTPDSEPFDLPNEPKFTGTFNGDDQVPLKFKKAIITYGRVSSIYIISPVTDQDRRFIMKQIYIGDDSRDDSGEAQHCFESESRALQAMGEHENIVKAYWIGKTEPDVGVIITEYLEYESLNNYEFDLQRHKPFIAFIAKSILEGLRHMHQEGYTHNDIRPENVAISGDGTVKLIDFDLAGSPSPTGCSAYKAAERHFNPNWDGIFTNKVDVYSLGMTLLSLTGNPYSKDGSLPTDNETVKKFYEKYKELNYTHFPFLPNVERLGPNDDYHSFLKQCLAFHAGDRASVDDLLKHRFIKRAVAKQVFLNALKSAEKR